MWETILIFLMCSFAIQAIRAKRLLASALWLAGVSALLSILFYLLGAYQIAVIELSIGAGLVTVLFVFAISIAGEDAIGARPLIPLPLALGLVLLSILLLAWFVLPAPLEEHVADEASLSTALWEARSLDVLLQITLIFAGVLGLLGLMAEAKAPLEYPAADETSAQRDRELEALQRQSLGIEKEST